jgi:hypothetical protein
MIYNKPETKTFDGFSTVLAKNEIVAILPANGHGEIDVNIPSQTADPIAIKKLSISQLL